MSGLLCFFFAQCILAAHESGPAESSLHASLLRHTQYGDVMGFESREGTANWLGIPFARPPVGRLRWRAPTPPEPWQGILKASNYGSACSQPATDVSPLHGGRVKAAQYLKEASYKGAEDCLYLNVQRPGLAERSNAGSPNALPVMVWLHGGWDM